MLARYMSVSMLSSNSGDLATKTIILSPAKIKCGTVYVYSWVKCCPLSHSPLLLDRVPVSVELQCICSAVIKYRVILIGLYSPPGAKIIKKNTKLDSKQTSNVPC